MVSHSPVLSTHGAVLTASSSQEDGGFYKNVGCSGIFDPHILKAVHACRFVLIRSSASYRTRHSTAQT